MAEAEDAITDVDAVVDVVTEVAADLTTMPMLICVTVSTSLT